MSGSRGFTLVELVIVVVIVGIMAAALAPVVETSLRAYNAVNGDIMVLDRLRYATERIAREIREVDYDSGTATFQFSGSLGTNMNSLTFTRTHYDAAGAGTTDTVRVRTSSTLTGCTVSPCVTLTYNGGTEYVLADELGAAANLSLNPLDRDSVATTSTSDVRYVSIGLTLVHNGNNYAQQTRVELKRR